jgi:hypothetical protein
MITKAQKDKAFKMSGEGRGGIFLDGGQRRALVGLTAKHYDKAVELKNPFTRQDIIQQVKSDPEIKGILPFILLTVLGAIVSWVIHRILDAWWSSD